MIRQLTNSIWDKVVEWLTDEVGSRAIPLSDFDRLRYEIRPGDVILVEGRTRISEIIKTITLSTWTHSAMYIGRLHNIDDPVLREYILKFYQGQPDDQLVIESLLGKGTIVDNISKYRDEHLRICRPTNLTRQDAQKVIAYAINQLGTYYNVRQIFDLARFFFPYGILPKRWRSSLFESHAGAPTHTVCSSMMAEAFSSVHFPILPILHRDEDGNLKMYKRNTKLITPKDFDYSPYFDVIKYPILDFDELAIYRKMPWDKDGVVLNDHNEPFIKAAKQVEKTVKDKAGSITDASMTDHVITDAETGDAGDAQDLDEQAATRKTIEN
jgi:hypothetical protein